jgi:hypothetical protein
MTNITDLDVTSVEYVCINLRHMDRLEVLNLADHDSSVRLAQEVYFTLRNQGRGRIVWHDGKPAAIVGFAEFRKGVWQAILLGTDDFRAVAKDALKWFRITGQEIRDVLGARRVQCDSHINHWEAHRFLRALGAQQEGPPMLAYGKDGSAFIRFVWFARQNDQWLKRKAA